MIIWISIIVSLLSPAASDKLEYDIYYRDRDIGDYIIERSQRDGLTHYKSYSVTEINLVGTISITVTQNVDFKDGIMIRSLATTKVNGTSHGQVKVEKEGHYYKLSSGNKVLTIKENIRHSMVRFMFHEPVGVERVFSEIDGEFHSIEKTAPGAYTKINSKGKKNYYLFDQKSMKHGDVDSGYYRFELRRRS